MNEFLLLEDHFQKKFPKDRIDLIQYSRRPFENDTIHFFLYLSEKLSFVISCYREKNKERLERENKVMRQLLSSLNSDFFKESILYTPKHIHIKNKCFRIQAYFDNRKYRACVKKMTPAFVKKILAHSTSWLHNIQSYSFTNEYFISSIIPEIEELKEFHKENKNIGDVIDILSQKIGLFDHRQMQCFVHGDYSFNNYFFVDNSDFFVFDWEYAETSYWAFYDPISNFISLWMSLFSRNKVRDLYDFVHGDSQDAYDEILRAYMTRIMDEYKLSIKLFTILTVFVYLKIFLRTDKYQKERFLPCYTNVCRLIK